MTSGKIRRIILILLAAVILVLALRFVLGGSEDAWICQGGEWIKHGNPSAPKPETLCENPAEELQKYDDLGTSDSASMSL